jgi:thiamine-phosphate pyrophosphorylase
VRPSDRADRLSRARLYVVTDARQGRGDLEALLEQILEAGVDVIQLRDKEAEAGDLLRSGETFRDAADRHEALFIVNDRPDIAAVLGADGVHLGQNDLPAGGARGILGAEGVIGLSTHSPEQFESASPEADYLCAGPVWETPTKPGRPAAGLDLIRHAAASDESRPWFAIGGIDTRNLAQVVEAGARRVVVVRAVTEAPDPGRAARELRERMAASGARS